MGYQKNTSNGLNLKKSLGLSIFLHGALFALLVFGLHGDTEKPAGSGESEIISVSLVASKTPSPLVGEGGGEGEKVENLHPPLHPLPSREGKIGYEINSRHLLGGEGGTSAILQQIRNQIERQKYYPLLAKRSRIEGSPLIEFKIKSDGSLEYVTLKQSSGAKILDEAATTTVRQAAPYPFYPEAIALNIHYTLAP